MKDTKKSAKGFLYFWYEMRGFLMAIPYIFALVCIWNENESFVIFPLGISLILAAFLIRFWAQMHLHYRLKIKKNLTMTGPYKYVRNPIYIANIMLLAGYVLMSELVWFVPVSIVYGYVVYRIVVAYEEFYLKGKYGAPYIEYLETVPRWMPKLASMTGKSFKDKMRERSLLLPSLKAEYQCVFIILPPILKELIEHYIIF